MCMFFLILSPLCSEKASMEAHIDAKAADVPELEEGSAERKKTKHGSNDDIFKIPPVPPGLLARIPYFAMLPFIAFYMQCKKGLFYDIHDKDMEMDEVTHELHAGAEVFHPNAEKVYEVLQVVSACCVAFAHGSNDVANAMGPFSAIYSVYTTHSIPGSKSEAPRWIFVIGGFGIILGLLMYGYNIIGHLGTHLIHLTPSRGFSAELAAGMTISLASFFGIPVSTTQIIVGSEVGVGLCEWRKGSIGWSVLGYTCLGWIWTILLGATMCAALFSAGVYAPSLPMSQDLAYYRKQLLMTQDATLTAMSTNNNEWINDAQWWSGAVVLPMTANGSALVTKISDLQDSYAGLRSPETYVGPDQVMWNFASGMEMADNYALSAIGQNDKGSVMDGTTALRFP
jgi:sodium-dependent phosphate transporter